MLPLSLVLRSDVADIPIVRNEELMNVMWWWLRTRGPPPGGDVVGVFGEALEPGGRVPLLAPGRAGEVVLHEHRGEGWVFT